jgi:hypothetical protein
MKSEKEINSDILKITMEINKNFPELSKYLVEMPVTIPDEEDPEITRQNLQEYSNSLQALLKKYISEHPGMAK